MPQKPELKWTHPANNDLLMIVDRISDDSPTAAQNLKDEIEAKTAALPDHPDLYKPGRMKGTRELVVGPNHVLIYRITDTTIDVLRVLDARQNWPPLKGGNSVWTANLGLVPERRTTRVLRRQGIVWPLRPDAQECKICPVGLRWPRRSLWITQVGNHAAGNGGTGRLKNLSPLKP